MPGEVPYFIEGWIVDITPDKRIAYAKVSNGNVYHLYRDTPYLEFEKLEKDTLVLLEVTSRLIQVWSAKIIENNRGVAQSGSAPGS